VFARHAAQALGRSRLFEREAVVRHRLERLQRLTSELSSAKSVQEVAHLSTRAATEALGLAAGALWLVNPDGDLLGVDQHGWDEGQLDQFRHVPRDSERPAARVARTRSVEWGTAPGGMSYAALPLVRDGGVLAVLGFGARGARSFTEDERAFIVTVADACADALARARSYDQAQAANRAKDDFLAMVGHELRNPLSPIVTAVHLMKMRGDTGNDRELRAIERQANHLVRLVDDLLDVSRAIRGGNLRLDRAPVELRMAVSAAIEMTSPIFEERHHELTVSVPATGLLVHGDAQRLTQVIANLLTNAAKYTPPLGHVAIRAHADAGQAVVEVVDDGIGIAPDLLPKAFEPFTQGKRQIDRKEGGLGLGLAIARRLMEQHGGTIHATSPGEGRGTTVTLRLPLSTNMAPTPPNSRRLVSSDVARRVLVVDDNEDAAELLEEVVRAGGHEARTASDGPSALELVTQFTPEIAFLDIGLPVMDGYELADRLRHVPGLSQTRLVAMTGYARAEDRDRALAHGFAEHMAKPVDPERVLACIERLVSSEGAT
jgi:signal transduction histidine kinase/ActR/RegA family two-component response regulator